MSGLFRSWRGRETRLRFNVGRRHYDGCGAHISFDREVCPECSPGNRLNGKNGKFETNVSQVSGKERA